MKNVIKYTTIFIWAVLFLYYYDKFMPEGILYLVIGIPALYLSVWAILYLFKVKAKKAVSFLRFNTYFISANNSSNWFQVIVTPSSIPMSRTVFTSSADAYSARLISFVWLPSETKVNVTSV